MSIFAELSILSPDPAIAYFWVFRYQELCYDHDNRIDYFRSSGQLYRQCKVETHTLYNKSIFEDLLLSRTHLRPRKNLTPDIEIMHFEFKHEDFSSY